MPPRGASGPSTKTTRFPRPKGFGSKTRSATSTHPKRQAFQFEAPESTTRSSETKTRNSEWNDPEARIANPKLQIKNPKLQDHNPKHRLVHPPGHIRPQQIALQMPISCGPAFGENSIPRDLQRKNSHATRSRFDGGDQGAAGRRSSDPDPPDPGPPSRPDQHADRREALAQHDGRRERALRAGQPDLACAEPGHHPARHRHPGRRWRIWKPWTTSRSSWRRCSS